MFTSYYKLLYNTFYIYLWSSKYKSYYFILHMNLFLNLSQVINAFTCTYYFLHMSIFLVSIQVNNANTCDIFVCTFTSQQCFHLFILLLHKHISDWTSIYYIIHLISWLFSYKFYYYNATKLQTHFLWGPRKFYLVIFIIKYQH